jgi:hypothetical protein
VPSAVDVVPVLPTPLPPSVLVDGVDVLKETTYVDRTRATSDAFPLASSLTALTERPHEINEST